MISVTDKYEMEDLSEFEAWSGAAIRLSDMQDHPKAFDYINSMVEDWSFEREQGGNPLTRCEINDFLWFDSDECLREAGLYNPETGLFYDEEGFDGEDEEDEGEDE